MTRKSLENLIVTVLRESSNLASWLHGPQHWRCVALVGIELARETPGADPLVALLFGLFHDSMRENEDDDPEHGARGAELFLLMEQRDLIDVSFDQHNAVIEACRTHTKAGPTVDPRIGVCYDADRLNLWRCHIKPKPCFLSTEGGKQRALHCTTQDLHETVLTWDRVLDLYFAEVPQIATTRIALGHSA